MRKLLVGFLLLAFCGCSVTDRIVDSYLYVRYLQQVEKQRKAYKKLVAEQEAVEEEVQ